LGGHAFSADGGNTWTYSGVAWGDPAQQGANVTFEDGSSWVFARRERPHFVFDRAGRIQALSTAVSFGEDGRGNTDGSATYIQPVATPVAAVGAL
jgi:hypothetical protein